ncbi:MAG: 3D domain-containing protein, partial [Clostridia bacterium]
GAVARVGLIAVDPRVIPLGTRLYITSMDGKRWVYGYAVAADTGGAIKGNKIDLFFNTEAECYDFGRQKAKVYILD